MKRLKYFILFLFIYSVFSSMLVLADANRDYDLWYQEHEWIMLKAEKADWKTLKTEQAREEFIEKFYTARDSDTFTFRNEFQVSYQKNLEKVRKDYSNFSDPRRYMYFLFGESDSKRQFKNLDVLIAVSPTIKIRVNEGEIWRYSFSGQNFQVIFAKLNIHQLQKIRDQRQAEGLMPASFSSSEYEILYVGLDKYSDIGAFLESFFQENFQLRDTNDTINDLKKQVLDRAERFYEKPKPKVSKNKYSKEWKGGMQVLIDQFDINSPQEAGIAIWILFDKDSLSYDSKKDKYSADISLYCEIRDANNKPVVYYCDDNINYKIKTAKAYYHFWGSLPARDYKLILELGDNIGKRYVKIEQDIKVFDYSKPGLKAGLLIGKIVEDSEIVKGKPCYLSFKEGKFCPAFSGEYFRDDDEMVVVLDISGFQKNLYGNSRLELILLFVNGDIQQGKFVPSNEVFIYSFRPIEKDESRFRSVVKLKIKDLVASLKLPSGCYQIKLQIEDKIANDGGTRDYSYPILILSVAAIQNNLNALIKGAD